MAQTSGAIKAGRAFVEVFADDSKAQRTLKAMEKRFAAWGKSLTKIGKKTFALGASIVAPLTLAAKSFADIGGSLQDMSDRTGVSAEGLQELGFAAAQTGGSLEDIEKGLIKMSRLLVEAASGSETAQETLAELGLTIGDLANLSPAQQFALIGDRLSQIRNPAQRVALAFELFGRSGTKLLPMLQNGARGLKEYAKQARDLGLVLSNRDVAAADDFGDKLDVLNLALKVSFATLGSALLPTLTQFVNRVIEVAGATAKWINQNRGLVDLALKAGVAIAGAGATFIALGVASKAAAIALGGAQVALKGIRLALIAIT